MVVRCCPCNGNRARCIRCSCVKNNQPCVSCVPKRLGNCHNIPSSRSRGSPSPSPESVHFTSPNSSSSSGSFPNASSPSPITVDRDAGLNKDTSILQQSEVDDLMLKAYGTHRRLHTSPDWTTCWHTITQLTGSHYFLPAGVVGHRYVTTLTAEIELLPQGIHASERLIVFSSKETGWLKEQKRSDGPLIDVCLCGQTKISMHLFKRQFDVTICFSWLERERATTSLPIMSQGFSPD